MSSNSPDSVSRTIGRLSARGTPPDLYRLGEEIGRGGQGMVLAVWDEDLRRNLAMKVLRVDSHGPGSDPRSLGRFLEEAHLTAQLDHPGIVPVHELGLDADARVYFTMKLVKGRNLGAVFELVLAGDEGWSQTRALNVLLKVCEVMAYAHSKGVIHRDLKPSNVMVGRFGEVYAMDWGLARVLGGEDRKDIRIRPGLTSELRSLRSDDDPDSPLITMDGDVVGTPAYMPPEQARGEIAAMGPHSDVYAVGAMLYQLLTGQMPYVSSGTRLSNRAIWALVQKGPPDPVHTLVAGVPAELVAICEKAMAREVSARYADMSGLAEDLRAYLEHRVVSAHETGTIAELRKWVARNRWLATSMASVFLAVVAGLIVSLVFKARADERKEDVLRLSARQELDDLTAEADRLWPAYPENAGRYREWLRRAEQLVAAIPEHETKLAALRARALPMPREERTQQRAAHPKLGELEREKRHLEFLRALAKARESTMPLRDSRPEEVGFDLAALPRWALEVNDLARPLVDPEREDWGGEALGLVLARHALELAVDSSPDDRSEIRDTLAWALFMNGRFAEALAEEKRGLEEASREKKEYFEYCLTRLEHALEEQDTGESARRSAELEMRIAELEFEVSQRTNWTFADSQDRWWHNQLEKLLDDLDAFADAETGFLSSGTSPEHGWGMKKRLDFASTIEERSVSGADAAAKWSAAIESIADVTDCPEYGGLRIVPQIGLLPIGRDPESGLWEFAHLQTGEPAERGADGKIVLKEETGLVLVLLPGGTFLMGAQATDPSGPNYSPQALSNQRSVHAVTLPPSFLSKYEMTQGQWQRITGRNPSSEKLYRRFVPSLLYPVGEVSWDMCRDVCNWAGLRLPTEAEWEYGTRGRTTTVWWTGNERDSLAGAVNLADQTMAREALFAHIQHWPELDDGYGAYAPVNEYLANPFGLHNVHGNMWEWCADKYRAVHGQDAMAELLIPEDESNRAIRGGCFGTDAYSASSAFRDRMPSWEWSEALGLRPARTVTP